MISNSLKFTHPDLDTLAQRTLNLARDREEIPAASETAMAACALTILARRHSIRGMNSEKACHELMNIGILRKDEGDALLSLLHGAVYSDKIESTVDVALRPFAHDKPAVAVPIRSSEPDDLHREAAKVNLPASIVLSILLTLAIWIWEAFTAVLGFIFGDVIILTTVAVIATVIWYFL